MLFDGGAGALCGVLGAYVGRRLCRPTLHAAKQRGLYERWPHVAPRGGEVAKYALRLL